MCVKNYCTRASLNINFSKGPPAYPYDGSCTIIFSNVFVQAKEILDLRCQYVKCCTCCKTLYDRIREKVCEKAKTEKAHSNLIRKLRYELQNLYFRNYMIAQRIFFHIHAFSPQFFYKGKKLKVVVFRTPHDSNFVCSRLRL